jgi:hypothetical protein
MSPFDYINSINDSKKDIMVDDASEKAYNAFIVNRGLSYFPDTVLYANEMNQRHYLDKKLQYHFLMNTVRKKKRFSKWLKPEKYEDLELLKRMYGYSNEKAKAALNLLNAEQLQALRASSARGGLQKRAS